MGSRHESGGGRLAERAHGRMERHAGRAGDPQPSGGRAGILLRRAGEIDDEPEVDLLKGNSSVPTEAINTLRGAIRA